MARERLLGQDSAVSNAREILSQIHFGTIVAWLPRGWDHVHALALAGAALGDPDEEIAALAASAVVVAERGGAQVACDLIDIAWSLLEQVDDRPLAQEHEVQLRATKRAVEATSQHYAPRAGGSARRTARGTVRSGRAVRRLAV